MSDSTNAKWVIDSIEECLYPPGRSIHVKVVAKIRRNDTGEIRDYAEGTVHLGDAFTDFPTEEDEANCFWWEEGNGSCDCNRAIFFEGYKSENTYPCGHGAYSVNLINPANGQTIYAEY